VLLWKRHLLLSLYHLQLLRLQRRLPMKGMVN
jgi:hypothetical protein